MKFYDCRTAPSPRRVRVLIAEKGIDIETVEVDLRNGEHLRAEFAAKNPDHTVPVLELDDGTCITEVSAICRYLDDVFPDLPLLGRDPRERAIVAMWVSKIEQQGLASVADFFRNSAKGFEGRALTGPHNYAQIPELAERGRLRIGHFLDRLDQQFTKSTFIASEYYSFADISALIFVEFAGRCKVEIGDSRPHLRRWYEEVVARPASAV